MNPLPEKVWQFESATPGPHLLVIGGVHGNELTGILVVEALRDAFTSGARTLASGTLTLALGNPRAIERGTRGSTDAADLNRLFSQTRFAAQPDGTYEDARARELASLLASATVLVDIHSTNKPSEPFLACKATPVHERVYRWFDATKVVTDPRYVLAGGEPGTTDEYAELFGVVGICYESGQAADTTRSNVVLDGIVHLMQDSGLLSGTPTLPDQTKELFELSEALVLTTDGFAFADGLGQRSFEEVRAGQTIGLVGERPTVASEDGVIVFPKIKEHWKIGRPVGFSARRLSYPRGS